MKRILSILLVATFVMTMFAGCTKVPTKVNYDGSPVVEDTTSTGKENAIKVDVTKNVVGMGALYFMRSIDNETTTGNYTYTQVNKASSDFTFAILPTEEAYNLVKKSDGKYQFVAVAAENNITFIELDDKSSLTLEDVKDSGDSVYVGLKGSITDRVLKFLFENNDIEIGKDVTFNYDYDEDTLASVVSKDRVRHCVLTEPYTSEGLSEAERERATLDIASLWEQTVVGTDYLGSRICSACIVVNAEFAKNNPSAVTKFLKEFNSSAKNVASQETAKELVVKYGYLSDKDDITGVIAKSNFTCVKGTNLKSVLGGFLHAIYGEEIPNTWFYMI